MRPAWVCAALALAGCHAKSTPHGSGDTPGDRLEAAAQAAGLVADPERMGPVGLYARDTDRICVVPGKAGAYRIGATVSYDEQHGCAAAGEAARAGDRITVSFGDCRFEARFEGDRIVFPPELPAPCDRFCTGRASLGALAAERISDSPAEAAALADARGHPLCGAN